MIPKPLNLIVFLFKNPVLFLMIYITVPCRICVGVLLPLLLEANNEFHDPLWIKCNDQRSNSGNQQSISGKPVNISTSCCWSLACCYAHLFLTFRVIHKLYCRHTNPYCRSMTLLKVVVLVKQIGNIYGLHFGSSSSFEAAQLCTIG